MEGRKSFGKTKYVKSQLATRSYFGLSAFIIEYKVFLGAIET